MNKLERRIEQYIHFVDMLMWDVLGILKYTTETTVKTETHSDRPVALKPEGCETKLSPLLRL